MYWHSSLLSICIPVIKCLPFVLIEQPFMSYHLRGMTKILLGLAMNDMVSILKGN
jgi:hypothetical protein